ncbi:hypothetical protein V8G54_037675 [Vigna mungo]|uniref:Retrotransposon Copia-like N-terminal domain-containing protein n=1 Tax=Vigna mungo TaxID=3915 RepID=A0AAQ3MJ51_VIGMU
MTSSGQSSFTTTGENSSSTGSSLSQIAMDSFTPQITNHKLSGHNYLSWSQFVPEIWEAAKLTYSIADNTSKLFETENTLISDKMPSHTNRLLKRSDFKFLSGLNKELDEVRRRIISTKPLPSLRAAFSAVRHEESRRKVMLKEQIEKRQMKPQR